MPVCRLCFLGIILLAPLSGAVYSGRALEDHSGVPLSRALIRLMRPGIDGIVAETESGPDGRFRTPELPDANYILEASKPNYTTVSMRAGSRPDPVLRLARYGAISGHILNGAGDAWNVVAFSESSRKSVPVADGEYRIFGLAPGRYRVALVGYGSKVRAAQFAPRDFVIAGGEEYQGVDLVAPDGAGYAVGGALPTVAGARFRGLVLTPAGHPYLRITQMPAKADGTFQFDHVVQGDYELLAVADAVAFGRARLTVAGQDVRVDLSIEPPRPVPFVLRSEPGCGSAARVDLTPVDAWILTPQATVSLAVDKPALASLAPGRFTVVARAASGSCYAAVTGSLDLTSGPASGPVEVRLTPGGSVRGSAPASGYVAVLIPPADGALRIEYPGADSTFGFDDVAPGRYSVVVVPAATGRWMREDGVASMEVRGGDVVKLAAAQGGQQ